MVVFGLEIKIRFIFGNKSICDVNIVQFEFEDMFLKGVKKTTKNKNIEIIENKPLLRNKL